MNMIESARAAALCPGEYYGGEMALPELLGEVMTRAGIGLILTAHDGEIVYANQLADSLLRASGGLRCERNTLIAQGLAFSRKLQPLIVAASRKRDELAQGGTMILRGEDAASPLVVHVIPLCECFDEDRAAEAHPAAGVLIVDCQQALAARMGAFAGLFALTPAETRVAAKLFSGEGIRKAASSLNIALSTAQSHLKHILEKTATHRQTELVKLFYQVTLPTGGGPEPGFADGPNPQRNSAGRQRPAGPFPRGGTPLKLLENGRPRRPGPRASLPPASNARLTSPFRPI